MREILILRLEAPLMAFGGELVDDRGVVRAFPALSMVTGLLGNALGYNRADATRLQALQDRLRMAVRADRPGERLTDYQTADLGLPFMALPGWTTRGVPQKRTSAKPRETTQRWRDYWADASYTVTLGFEPGDASPTVHDLDAALRAPARPLFIGRKPCLPSRPLSDGVVRADTVFHALRAVPLARRGRSPCEAWWPAEIEVDLPYTSVATVADLRDWANNIHAGQRRVLHGILEEPEVTNAD